MEPLDGERSRSCSYHLNRWLYSAGISCVAFGLLLIFQTQGAGDGTWFWYAEFFRQGHRLYSGMHLALQPLFVLETAAWMALVGKGWLLGKVPAVLHLIAFVLPLVLLVRKIAATDRQRGAILLLAFFASISFEAYRFDDYHVIADLLQLYSILVLLRVQREENGRIILLLAGVLGILSGLAITCRLNDGLALWLGVVVAFLWLAKSRQLTGTLVFCATAALTVALVVRLTGDTFHDYLNYSLLKAAGNKGGGGSLLLHPIRLPLNSIEWIWSYLPDGSFAWLLLTLIIWGVLIAPLRRQHGPGRRLFAALGIFLLLFSIAHVLVLFFDPHVLWNLSAVVVVFTYAMVLWTTIRLIFPKLRDERFGPWDVRQVLLIIPLGQLASGSMSSGGVHLSLYGPEVVALLMIAIGPQFRIRIPWFRDVMLGAAVILGVSLVTVRIAQPYSWLTYREQPLFVGRAVYYHPEYGPMVIDRDLLQMIRPVCDLVKTGGGSDQELLSIPFSYANYFCAMPPWHGYVQTFYDTSSVQTVRELMQQLQESPPTWVFYQRQLKSLALHEKIYNHGNPLEQRRLDEMIQQKVATGQWHIVYRSDFNDSGRWDNHWFLIRTR